MQYSILQRHYLNYLESINTNKKLISQTLSAIEIQNLYNKKYQLTEFDIYKYITAYDHIVNSMGCDKYKLTEGILSDKNKYNNILIDLYYQNISSQLIINYPISIIFSIKQDGDNIQDLTQNDMDYWRSYFDYEACESDPLNYFYEELQLYKSIYKGYSGNSYTDYTFKRLVKNRSITSGSSFYFILYFGLGWVFIYFFV